MEKHYLLQDTSVITLSNYSNVTGIWCSNKNGYNIIPRARISCIMDVLTNMIISSEITVESMGEPKIAIN